MLAPPKKLFRKKPHADLRQIFSPALIFERERKLRNGQGFHTTPSFKLLILRLFTGAGLRKPAPQGFARLFLNTLQIVQAFMTRQILSFTLKNPI